MPLSKDAADIQDRIADFVEELTIISKATPFMGSETQIDKPIDSLKAAFFELDKTIGVLARLERQDG